MLHPGSTVILSMQGRISAREVDWSDEPHWLRRENIHNNSSSVEVESPIHTAAAPTEDRRRASALWFTAAFQPPTHL